MIDRCAGRDVLVATNVAFTIDLVAIAGLYGRDARNAIMGITLFASFASTVGRPTSAIFMALLTLRAGEQAAGKQ